MRQFRPVGTFTQFIEPVLAGVRRRRESNRLMKEANRLYKAGKFAEAADVYGRGVEVDPDRLVMRFNFGLALYKSGRKPQARAEWSTVRDEARRVGNAYLTDQAEIMLRQFG